MVILNMSNFLHFVDKLQLLEASFEGINCLSKSLVVVKLYFQIKFPTPYFHENLDWSIRTVPNDVITMHFLNEFNLLKT